MRTSPSASRIERDDQPVSDLPEGSHPVVPIRFLDIEQGVFVQQASESARILQRTSCYDDPVYFLIAFPLTPLHHLAPDASDLVRDDSARARTEGSMSFDARAKMRSGNIVFLPLIVSGVRD